TQTRRHSYIVSLLGIKHVAVAINKLDLVDYSEDVFTQIEADYLAFAAEIGLDNITCIPMSAQRGEPITSASEHTPRYSRPTLTDEIDCSRGDVLCAAGAPAPSADQFRTHLVWMSEEPLQPGRAYLMKIGARTVGASISGPEFRIDVNTLEQQTASTLCLNE